MIDVTETGDRETMGIDILKDISTLTTIPEQVLEKLVDIAIMCINDAYVESLASGDTEANMRIGLGDLRLRMDGNTVKLRLTPSAKLQESIANSTRNRESAVDVAVSASLRDKLINTYKELL